MFYFDISLPCFDDESFLTLSFNIKPYFSCGLDGVSAFILISFAAVLLDPINQAIYLNYGKNPTLYLFIYLVAKILSLIIVASLSC